MKIPKIIHQTYKTITLPRVWRESPLSISKYMPNWQYNFYTDEDNRTLVKKYFPEYLKTYDNFLYPIQRVDMVRVMYLYLYGGIYMDLDYVVRKPLDELFENDSDLYFVSSANIGSYMTNSFMASIPKHSFWLEYLKHMKEDAPLWALTKHFHIMLTTGPMALTKVLKNTRSVYSLLPQKHLIPCDLCSIGNCPDYGYLKAISGSSWHSLDSTILNFLYCNWKLVLVCIFVLIIILALWLYRKDKKTGNDYV